MRSLVAASALLAAVFLPPSLAEQVDISASPYGSYVTSGAISTTAASTATQPVSPTFTLTPTATVTATIRPTRTVAPTPTITPTLAPEWGVDALCRCHVPPLEPGSPECERLKAEYIRDVLRAWASQTALVRGTDTPTPTATDTPTATLSPTATLRPTLTVAPTEEPTPSPAPTWTPRVVVVTATAPPIVRRAWLPFAFLRRPRR